jgi:hypothetical protein
MLVYNGAKMAAQSRKFASGALATLGAAFMLLAPVAQAGPYTFQTLDKSTDPTFNELLGVNNAGLLVGFYGSGSALNPNKGYSLASPYGQANYTNENFPASAQTQVTGINNSASGVNVGFWTDSTGDTFGFVDQGGAFTTVSDPAAPNANVLLGVNDSNVAAGFYTDSSGNAHPYLYSVSGSTFTAVNLPGSFNATSAVATGINNGGVVSGYYTDTSGKVHGFIDNAGTFTSFDDPNGSGSNTMFLGLNNNGQVVGSYVDAGGLTNGFVYDIPGNSWLSLDDPSASTTAAFGVNGTAIAGINDSGIVVGFYSDGANVNGFLATTVPEPACWGFMSLGIAALAFIRVYLQPRNS